MTTENTVGLEGGAGSPSRPEFRGHAHPQPASSPGTQSRPESGTHPKPSRLWLWFVAVFLLQFGVWGAWITLAAKNKVAEVPLVTAQPHKR